MAASRHSVLILGHSYVHRLEEFVNHCKSDGVTPNFGLDPDRVVVNFAGYGGAHIGRIHDRLEQVVTHFRPDFVILQVGSNDISQVNNNPDILSENIIQLANRLIVQYDVHKVAVSELFFRNKWRGGNFNDTTREINAHLRVKLSPHSETAGVSFWRHFGFSDAVVRRSLQHVDQVHFNDAGNLKYYKSLKRAILKAF